MTEAAYKAHQQRIHKPEMRAELVDVLRDALWVRPKIELGPKKEFSLPWPPSVNHYWFRNKNGSMRIGEAGLAFRNNVGIICKGAQKLSGRLRIDVRAFPPDNRRRDIDNLGKAVFDSLQHAGVIEDDNQFDDIRIRRGAVQKPGRLIVEISTI